MPFILARMTNKVNHLSIGKQLVPKHVVIRAPGCCIPTVQSDWLSQLTGYVWLVLNNCLRHSRSCGEKISRQSWSNEQNNVGIRLIWDRKKTQIEIIISMLFSNPPFLPSPCEAPHACVQSFHPEHSHPCLEASIPEKVKARSTQSRLENGMRHGFPCTNVLSSASSWEFSVFECLAAHIHTTQYLCDSPQQEMGAVMFIDHICGLCTYGNKVWLTTTLFCLLVFSW